MFNKTQRYVMIGSALLLISCTDISRFCRHGGNGYLQRWMAVSAEAAEATTAVALISGTAAMLPGSSEDLSPAAVISCIPPSVPTQEKGPRPVTWRLLKDVVFNRIWDEKMDMPMLYPQFSRGIKSLNGEYIRISGYVIPLDVNGGIYVLSANPNNACFFCGGAGPESVMALKLKPRHARFKTDDYLTFTGRLRLNEKNIYELYYNLEGADVTP